MAGPAKDQPGRAAATNFSPRAQQRSSSPTTKIRFTSTTPAGRLLVAVSSAAILLQGVSPCCICSCSPESGGRIVEPFSPGTMSRDWLSPSTFCRRMSLWVLINTCLAEPRRLRSRKARSINKGMCAMMASFRDCSGSSRSRSPPDSCRPTKGRSTAESRQIAGFSRCHEPWTRQWVKFASKCQRPDRGSCSKRSSETSGTALAKAFSNPPQARIAGLLGCLRNTLHQPLPKRVALCNARAYLVTVL